MASFGWGLLSLLGSALAAVLLSEEFRALVFTHFGNSFIAGVIMLFVPEAVKHLRNVWKLGRLGAEKVKDIILI